MSKRGALCGVATLAAACTFAVSPVTAAPTWGQPVPVDRTGLFDDATNVFRIVKDQAGEPLPARAAIPDEEIRAIIREFSINASGDLLEARLDGDGFVTVFTPAGGPPVRHEIDASQAALVALTRGESAVVRLSRTGDGFVLWQGGDPARVAVSYRTRQGGPEPARVISTPKRRARVLALSIGGNGAAAVLWSEQVSDTVTELRSIVRPSPAGAWSEPMTLPAKSETGTLADIAIDESGNARAIWIDDPDTVMTAGAPAGASSWGEPRRLGRVSEDVQPLLQTSANGNAIAAWIAPDRGDDLSVMASRGTTTGEMGTAVRLARDVYSYSLVADISDSGTAAVGWAAVIDHSFETAPKAAVTGPGGAWTRPQFVAAPDAGPEVLSYLAIGPSGRAIAETALFDLNDVTLVRRYVAFGEQTVGTDPVAISRVTVPRDVVAGSLAWSRVRLSRGVLNAKLEVQERRGSRWVTVARRRVSGRTAYVAVPTTTHGRRIVRAQITSGGRTAVSSPTGLTVGRPTEPTVGFGAPVQGIARAGRQIWALVGPPGSRRLQRFDPSGGRRTGPARPAGDATLVAGHEEILWTADLRSVTAFDARSGRKLLTRRVTRKPGQWVVGLGATPSGAWVVTASLDDFTLTDLRVVQITRRGTIGQSLSLEFDGSVSQIDSIAQSGDSLWVGGTRSGLAGSSSAVVEVRLGGANDRAVDGRQRDGSLATGYGQTWVLGAIVARVAPRPGPSATGTFLSGDRGIYALDVLVPASAAPDGVWAVRADTGFAEGQFRQVRFIDGRSGRTGPPVRFGPRAQDNDQKLTGPSIVAVADGAWVTAPDLGLVTKVTRRR